MDNYVSLRTSPKPSTSSFEGSFEQHARVALADPQDRPYPPTESTWDTPGVVKLPFIILLLIGSCSENNIPRHITMPDRRGWPYNLVSLMVTSANHRTINRDCWNTGSLMLLLSSMKELENRPRTGRFSPCYLKGLKNLLTLICVSFLVEVSIFTCLLTDLQVAIERFQSFQTGLLNSLASWKNCSGTFGPISKAHDHGPSQLICTYIYTFFF